MKYTDKNYYIDERLREKMDLMVERVVKHKFDNLVIIDGKEGYGKSNLAAAMAYYFAWKSKRTFSSANLFFLVDDILKYATKTSEQIIWWDEAALGGLASESYSKIQTKLLKLLMVARKKKHFYIFVIPKYFKLREGIIDRAVCLVHTYSRDEITRGRFTYYRANRLEEMYQRWKKSGEKGYKRYSFHGTFPEALPLILNEKNYDEQKDKAILTIGETDTETKSMRNLREKILNLQYRVAMLPTNKEITRKEILKHFGIGETTLLKWKNLSNKGKVTKEIGSVPLLARNIIEGNELWD